ncbi:MAG: protein YgfX [Lactobacillus panisapium]
MNTIAANWLNTQLGTSILLNRLIQSVYLSIGLVFFYFAALPLELKALALVFLCGEFIQLHRYLNNGQGSFAFNLGPVPVCYLNGSAYRFQGCFYRSSYVVILVLLPTNSFGSKRYLPIVYDALPNKDFRRLNQLLRY